MQSQYRNIEQISEDTGADYHQMQPFITESAWDARDVINHVAVDENKNGPGRRNHLQALRKPLQNKLAHPGRLWAYPSGKATAVGPDGNDRRQARKTINHNCQSTARIQLV